MNVKFYGDNSLHDAALDPPNTYGEPYYASEYISHSLMDFDFED